jgi:hypothetical protein
VRPFGKRVEILLYGSRSVLLLRHRFHWSTSQLALVATKKFKLSRCGWLPVNRRVSREDPDRLNMLRLCAHAWPKKRLITFSMPMPDSTYCHASPACCHVQAVPVCEPRLLLEALFAGARAWIEQAIPDVSELNLPDSTLETCSSGVCRADFFGMESPVPGFWSMSWRQAQEYEFSQSSLRRGTEIMKVGQVKHRRGCCLILLGGMRNETEHGADVETQRLIRASKCERAIRRLYLAGSPFPITKGTFRDPIDDVLQISCQQERWVTLTEEFLPKAKKGQSPATDGAALTHSIL